MEVQEIIKTRRMELGLSIREVAQALGVAASTVSRYESSDIQNMGIDKIESLAKVLHCSPTYLMGWDDSPTHTCSDQFPLSPLEKEIITQYRKADDITQAMVLRVLTIEEQKKQEGSA